VEEIPRRKTGRVIGENYLYIGDDGIHVDRIQTIKSALIGLGWNLEESLHIEPLMGLSNHNYKIFSSDYTPLFLRIFNPDIVTRNQDERHIQNCGFGAQVVHRFDWGRLEKWLPGRTMQREDCDNSQVLAAFANELCRLHKVAKRNHNDLNFTNVMIRDSDAPPTTHFLDFEYAGPLDPPFDVANFFCEWMYDNESPQWFEPNPKLFPSDEQARSFIALYLGVSDYAGSEVSDFLKEVLNRIPLVHTYWIDWALTNFSDQDEYIQYSEHRKSLMNWSNNL